LSPAISTDGSLTRDNMIFLTWRLNCPQGGNQKTNICSWIYPIRITESISIFIDPMTNHTLLQTLQVWFLMEASLKVLTLIGSPASIIMTTWLRRNLTWLSLVINLDLRLYNSMESLAVIIWCPGALHLRHPQHAQVRLNFGAILQPGH